MSLKAEFLEKVLDPKANITALCLKFDISRKTAYKWMKRYQEAGLEGLADRSKRPLISPFRTSEEMISLILKTRKTFH